MAHENGIVHRDLKPENVMIRTDAGGVHAVVMDFGLAKERNAGKELEKLTATGIVLGTPEFMSPEQLRGKSLDRRSDVYALGLVTYEMLTGKLPFGGRTQQALMIARLKEDPITAARGASRPAVSASGGRRAREGDAARAERPISDGGRFRESVRGGRAGRTKRGVTL